MRRHTLLFLGLFVMFLPYLGLPYALFRPLLTAAGLLIVLLLLLPRRRKASHVPLSTEVHNEIPIPLRTLQVEHEAQRPHPGRVIERPKPHAPPTSEAPAPSGEELTPRPSPRRRKPKPTTDETPEEARARTASSLENFLEGNTHT